MANNAILEVRTSLDHENLHYLVEIKSQDGDFICCETEDYQEALFVAKEVYKRLEEKQKQEMIRDIETIIEAEYGSGIAYDINKFSPPSDFCQSYYREFYRDLWEEIECLKLSKKVNSNEGFREVVSKHKLNEKQEYILLQYIKNIMEKSEKV
jgi:hypothetical protein